MVGQTYKIWLHNFEALFDYGISQIFSHMIIKFGHCQLARLVRLVIYDVGQIFEIEIPIWGQNGNQKQIL